MKWVVIETIEHRVLKYITIFEQEKNLIKYFLKSILIL